MKFRFPPISSQTFRDMTRWWLGSLLPIACIFTVPDHSPVANLSNVIHSQKTWPKIGAFVLGGLAFMGSELALRRFMMSMKKAPLTLTEQFIPSLFSAGVNFAYMRFGLSHVFDWLERAGEQRKKQQPSLHQTSTASFNPSTAVNSLANPKPMAFTAGSVVSPTLTVPYRYQSMHPMASI